MEKSRQEEWKSHTNSEEYKKNMQIFSKFQEQSLKIIKEQNEIYSKRKVIEPLKETETNIEAPPEALRAYKVWKSKIPSISQALNADHSEVCVENLLFLIYFLSSSPSKSRKTELEICIKRQTSDCKTFWDAPSCVLRAIRQCILTRDWDKMSQFLLILLKYDNIYTEYIIKMCRLMVKCHPKVQQLGLEDDLNTIIGGTQTDSELT